MIVICDSSVPRKQRISCRVSDSN